MRAERNRLSLPLDATAHTLAATIGFILFSAMFGCTSASREDDRIEINLSAPVQTIDAAYLSYSLDIGMLVGDPLWDGAGGPLALLEHETLRRHAKALAPAILRVGGTAGDETYYDLPGGPSPVTLPPGYAYRLTESAWEALAHFADAAEAKLVFGLNAGPGPRDEFGAWQDGQARRLLRHSDNIGLEVAAWELGNEPNVFLLAHSEMSGFDAATLATDYVAFAALRDEIMPDSLIAGPAAAYWPVWGELPFRPIQEAFLRSAGSLLDVVTWHFYPTQSRDCPLQLRPATTGVLLSPETLAEVDGWSAQIRHWRDSFAPNADVWMGESGNVQCGGTAGVSDRFASSFWWVGQLGRLARDGHRLVIRQTLLGGHYGLLDRETLAPRPDYAVSLLWTKTMGRRVLDVRQEAATESRRLFAHCGASGPNSAVTLAALNLRPTTWTVLLPADLGNAAAVYTVIASGPSAAEVRVNGVTYPMTKGDPSLPPAEIQTMGNDEPMLSVPPLGIVFATFDRANAPACR